MKTEDKTRKIVQSFLDALNSEDFASAKTYLSDDMKFIGIMGTSDSADNYIKDMEKMHLKYDIQKLFHDNESVAAFYDITMEGIKIFCAGWYEIENGKISTIKVIFDPTPLQTKQ